MILDSGLLFLGHPVDKLSVLTLLIPQQTATGCLKLG